MRGESQKTAETQPFSKFFFEFCDIYAKIAVLLS
jgi:hypothetical protein